MSIVCVGKQNQFSKDSSCNFPRVPNLNFSSKVFIEFSDWFLDPFRSFRRSFLHRKGFLTRNGVTSVDSRNRPLATKTYHASPHAKKMAAALWGVDGYELYTRIARIYRPIRSPTQRTYPECRGWSIEFDADRTRHLEQLMGWCASSDPHAGLTLEFETKEEAVRFCEQMGWDYRIEDLDTEEVDLRPKSYADRFRYRPPPPEEEELD